jgi:signal transduction histidine kinase
MSSRYEMQTYGSDEISQLGRDFNNMAERLQQTIEEQKQLVRDISHELRSPLGRIQVALALAQKKCGEDISELHRVEKECGRLNEMIAQLLVIPDSDQQLTDCIDLVGLLEEIANDAQLQAEQANKTITIDTPLTELLVNTSGGLLWHAIDNIVRNALRHSPAGSTVAITLSFDGNTISIAVSDQGQGVPDDAIQKIFQPFYRVETARDRNSGGYGLGLSIAHRAVARHGGNITAENFSGGFRVKILLPGTLINEDTASK